MSAMRDIVSGMRLLKVTTAPANAAGRVGVSDPSTGQQVGVTPFFTPRGSQLPIVGDPCFVDDTVSGQLVIVSWRRASEL